MDGCGLWVRRKADAQTGVRNQHRLQRPGACLGVRATVQQEADDSCVGFETNLRSNAIRHTVDALASRGDEGRDKLR
jgi:hypothetical protein